MIGHIELCLSLLKISHQSFSPRTIEDSIGILGRVILGEGAPSELAMLIAADKYISSLYLIFLGELFVLLEE